MTLKTQMVSDVADVFLDTDEHAELIDLIPPDGIRSNDVAAIVEREEALRVEPNAGDMLSAQMAVIYIPSTYQIREGWRVLIQADVDENETLEDNTWSVSGNPRNDGCGMTEVRLVRYRTREKAARDNFRFNRPR